ncbi:hypothetical protein [Leptospira stimsonii]|uniref:Uncharacterized protein n=1 Tax=Leptospira stimsonii TaxID=2202203 RepID=A0A396YMA1_9LEPT|nr:hypothetical protein [Leptospira stimsonii]RHX83915.1 hypothetical protein DLM75_23510 [Leptospira stimsonii]
MKLNKYEKIVEKYLISFDLEVEKIEENHYPNQRVPDFRVSSKDGKLFFVEVKSPELLLNQESGGYSFRTTENKLFRIVYDSIAQFKTFNSLHMVPNVLIITSSDFQLNFSNFWQSINGSMSVQGEEVYNIRSRKDFQVMRNNLKNIDLIIWHQIGNDSIYETVHFVNPTTENGRNLLILNQIFNLSNLKKNPRIN